MTTSSEEEISSGLPDIARLYEMVDATIEGLPDAFRDAARAVIVQIVDWPELGMLQALEITDPLDLTGLYDGVPLTEKSFVEQPLGADVIWLFREPILAEWMDRQDVSLERLVGHVYVHELAHHFGWSDEDIAEIDRWWE